jgi:hypothetical protein
MRLVLLSLILLLPNASAGSGEAATLRAAEALRTDPVYVDPKAENAISAAEAGTLRRRIVQSGAAPMYVAILPAAAGPAGVAGSEIEQRLGRPGIYAVVAGDELRAAGSDPRGAQAQANAAFEAHGDEGMAAVLTDFADRVGQLRAGRTPDLDGGSGGIGAAIVVALIVLVAGSFFLSSRRRRAYVRGDF